MANCGAEAATPADCCRDGTIRFLVDTQKHVAFSSFEVRHDSFTVRRLGHRTGQLILAIKRSVDLNHKTEVSANETGSQADHASAKATPLPA